MKWLKFREWRLQSRILGLIFCLLLMLAISVVWVSKVRYQAGMTEELEKRALLLANYTAERVIDPLLTQNRIALELVLAEEMVRYPDLIYILVIDSKQQVVGHTYSNGIPRALVDRARHISGKMPGIQHLHIDAGPAIEAQAPLLRGSAGQILVAIQADAIQAAIMEINRWLFGVVAFVLIIGLGLAAFLVRSMTRPLADLRRSALSFADGDFSQRIEERGGKEISLLALALNRMAEQLGISQQELVSAKEQTESIVNNLSDALWVVDRDAKIIQANPAAETLTGFTSDQLLNRDLSELIRIGERDLFQEFPQLLDGDSVMGVEGECCGLNGTTTPVHISAGALTNAVGRAEGVVVVVRDIALLKHAQRLEAERRIAAESSEGRLTQILHATPDMVCLADKVGQIRFLNLGTYEEFGLDTEIEPPSLAELFWPDSEQAAQSALNAAREHGVWRGESAIAGRNGRVPISLIVLTHTNEAGEVEYLSVLARDVSESHQRLEEQQVLASLLLAASTESNLASYLHSSLAQLLDIEWLSLQKQGAIFLCLHNELEMAAQIGLNPLLQARCNRVQIGECICGTCAASKEVVIETTLTAEHTIRTDGMQPHGHICLPLLAGKQLLGVLNLYMSDGTQPNDEEIAYLRSVADVLAVTIARRQAELQLVDAKEAAEAGTRAKSEFLATMSHEIRTPLNGVLGMADILMETTLDDEQRDYVGTIIGSGNTLLGIISDILDFSKIEAGRLDLETTSFDLLAASEEVTALMAPRAGQKGLELLFQYAPTLPRRWIGDAGRIRQVLVNLVGNAVKFTNAGHVLVSISNLSDDEAHPSGIRVKVEDTGVGISSEVKDKLFSPFTQADSSTTRKFGGTGLGLAICRQLVQLMGGDIGLEKRAEGGSIFWFELPLEIDRASPLQLPQESLQGKRLLFVDQNSVNRRIYGDRFNAWGMQTTTVADGWAALTALYEAAENNNPYAVAVLESQLPELSGREVAERVRGDERISDTPLLLLAASALRGEGQEMKRSGFDAFLVKPVRQDLLQKTLESLLAREPRHASKSEPQMLTRHDLVDVEKRVNGAVHLLLAEDNIVNQKVAVKMLEHLGCKVEVANNGQEALTLWEKGQYDAILMDCQMPVMDGYSAARAIREAEGITAPIRTPIIAVTAGATKDDRDNCFASGMDDYITKPYHLHTMESLLARLDSYKEGDNSN